MKVKVPGASVPAGKLSTLPDGRLKIDTARRGFEEVGAKPADWPGKFADAIIDPRHIKNVYLGVKPFGFEPVAAHSVLIFEMDDDHPVTNSQGQADPGLVLSMEASTHQGEQYKMLKTLDGKYPVVYKMETLSDLVQKTTRREGHRFSGL